jgi:hypothetical protein
MSTGRGPRLTHPPHRDAQSLTRNAKFRAIATLGGADLPERFSYLWRRFRPSFRLRSDPLAEDVVDDRYVPVSVANFKLIAPVARVLRDRRGAQALKLKTHRRPPLQEGERLAFASGKRLTVVIPFRDREVHLAQMLPELTRQLAMQEVEHRILVVEQEAGLPFNRGALINVGFRQAADYSDYYCIHDVDAVPVHANYLCPSQPLRLVTRLSSTNRGVQQHSAHYFSGAVSLLREHAYAVNGFSNGYWGWGKEDDDFLFRLVMGGFVCYLDRDGEFHDLPNPQEQQVKRSGAGKALYPKANRQRKSLLLRGLLDPATDGLSTMDYRVTARRKDQGRDDGVERITVRLQPAGE